MVTQCVCYDVQFTDMKRVMEETGARTVEELQTHIEFGENCQLCLQYVRKMMETGQTEFDVEWVG
jgi:bacterioferritin-associated ferredoxin